MFKSVPNLKLINQWELHLETSHWSSCVFPYWTDPIQWGNLVVLLKQRRLLLRDTEYR